MSYEISAFEGAACSQLPRADVDRAFFSSLAADRNFAKSVCAVCPTRVRDACLRMALEAERGASIYERHGVFGGTVPSERLRMQKEAS